MSVIKSESLRFQHRAARYINQRENDILAWEKSYAELKTEYDALQEKCGVPAFESKTELPVGRRLNYFHWFGNY